MSAKEGTSAKTSQEPDVVDLIVEDHVLTRTLYKKLQENSSGKDDQRKNGEEGLEELKWSIAKHAVAEELVFYPLLENQGGSEGKRLANESREDHEKTKMAMNKIDGIPLSECRPDLDKMMTELIEHMEKEETGDLVKIREQLSKEKLIEAAKQFDLCKKFAPQAGKDSKLPFETANQLMQAPRANLAKAFEGFGGIGQKTGKSGNGTGKNDEAGMEQEGDEQEQEGGGKYNLRQRDEQGHAVVAEKEKLDLGHGDDEGPQFASHKKTGKNGQDNGTGERNGTEKKSPSKTSSPNQKQGGGQRSGDGNQEGHGKRKEEEEDSSEPSHKKLAIRDDNESGGTETDLQ